MPTNGASEDLRRLTIPAGPAVQQVLPALREMLAGRGPLILPMAPGERLEPATRSRYLRDVTGLAVGTSGSTGAKKRAVLPTAALRASIDATHDRLGGPGPWLLALPAHHIAGLQVLLRSLVAGVDPVVAPDGLPFPTGFAAAAAQFGAQGIDHPRWYTAVVPAQLPPLLDDPHASAALRRCAGVLCGGAALSSALRDQAQSAGVRMVTTYGMSETAGGCVYDGTPLAGVATSVQADRIWLGGPTVAAGYLDDPQRSAAAFVLDAAGTRWFGTDDLGEIGPDGSGHRRGHGTGHPSGSDGPCASALGPRGGGRHSTPGERDCRCGPGPVHPYRRVAPQAARVAPPVRRPAADRAVAVPAVDRTGQGRPACCGS